MLRLLLLFTFTLHCDKKLLTDSVSGDGRIVRTLGRSVGAGPVQQTVERKPFRRHAVGKRHRRIVAVRAVGKHVRHAREVVRSRG